MLVVPAYAKINLALEVLARREDGLHEIESVMVSIDWHDLVGLSAGTESGRLDVTGPAAVGLPADASNLAAVAARSVEAAVGSERRLTIWLDKHIPTRAGLGGGSADAAAVLRHGPGCLGPTPEEPEPGSLRGAAVSLGADVPAMLVSGTRLVTGIGERVQPCRHANLNLAVVMAEPAATAAAYAALRPSERQAGGRVRRVLAAIEAGTRPLEQDLGSALEDPACRANRQLRRRLGELRDRVQGARWHLTGSGGCAFAIAASQLEAERLAAAAVRAGFPARACRTVGPALSAPGSAPLAGPAARFAVWPQPG